ncbi:MAG: hypothetical protein JXL80_06500 [Planctomycetes bacterium]|nr:hypothetical protein [Planctomycetota bacterium]
MQIPSDDQKRRVGEAYRAGRPIRVPVALGVNPRVVLLDPAWNTGGWTFEDYWRDARVTIEVQLKFLEYKVTYLSRFCDEPADWPETFAFYVDVQNVYDSAYFGAPVRFQEGQVPDAAPVYDGDRREHIFDVEIDHPMDNPFVRETLRRYEELKKAAAGVSFHGVALAVAPPLWNFDGPLTIATNVRGGDVYADLRGDPEYVERLLDFITRGVTIRNRAMHEHFGRKAFDGPRGGMADDSVQLISTEMYRRQVLPLHRRYLSEWSVEGPHSMHLCGDATRHFPLIRDELNVRTFDTGFPVDHGALRRELGGDVEILGGPDVMVLHDGSPQEVYERTRDILRSGVMDGGRFVLREGNNLPPQCPEENLAAFYRAALEFGFYGDDDHS